MRLVCETGILTAVTMIIFYFWIMMPNILVRGYRDTWFSPVFVNTDTRIMIMRLI